MTDASQTSLLGSEPTRTTQTIDIDGLNPAQREAVLCTSGPLLVLAGAGSGKTRVLTYRIAHMIADEGVRPWQVLAITFTNKAAAEMRERLAQLLPGGTRGMWVCTFHAMCVRILREDPELVGYAPNFTIYDDDDSKRLVKSIMNDLDIDAKQFPPQAIRSLISTAKNALVSPDDMQGAAQTPLDRKAAQVYHSLQTRLERANAMDFDDLLVRAYELLSKNPSALLSYQERFRHISVDEYQDTNHVQYAITNLLAGRYRNLMVVGDDDQSIYSWRGADIKNILAFEKDYPDAHVVKLEQNYRSTGHILNAANAVVAHNSRRTPKRLFTDAGDGERIRVYQASDERDEGRWIGSEIEKLHDAGTSYDDTAVFYRTNAQSRVLEDMFLRAGVPYKIVGGTRFFDRQEIRDVMAYLKVVVNPNDDVAALRVVNTPRRGIGSTSIAKIQAYGVAHGLSFFSAAEACIAESELLGAKARNALGEFTGAIEAGRAMTGGLSDVVEAIVDRSGLIKALEAEHSVEADGRIENIKEFYGVAAEFDEAHDDVVETLESLEQLRQAGALDQPAPVPVEPAKPELPPVASEKLAHGVARAEVRSRRAQRLAECRHDDDRALGQGLGVSRGLRLGHGGGHLPAPGARGRPREHRGGAPSGIRRHHACTQAPLPHLRRHAAHVRLRPGEPAEPLRERGPRVRRRGRGRGLGRALGSGLGEARRPPWHLRQRARVGRLRRPCVRLAHALDGRLVASCRGEPDARPPRSRQDGGVVCGRRPHLPQDVRTRRGALVVRRRHRGQVHPHRTDEEAHEGLRTHRQDRGIAMDQATLSDLASRAITLGIAVAIAVVVIHLLEVLVKRLTAKMELRVATIFINLVRGTVWVIALLSVLEPVFNIQPTAFVTALGVTGVAISLGLQDTVSNVIGGMALMTSRVIQPGDWITVGTVTGKVTDITWRSTMVTDSSGNVEVIPNSVLNKTALVRLETWKVTRVDVPVKVGREADLDIVSADIVTTVTAALGDDLYDQLGVEVVYSDICADGFDCIVRPHVKYGVSSSSVTTRVVGALAGRPWVACHELVHSAENMPTNQGE